MDKMKEKRVQFNACVNFEKMQAAKSASEIKS